MDAACCSAVRFRPDCTTCPQKADTLPRVSATGELGRKAYLISKNEQLRYSCLITPALIGTNEYGQVRHILRPQGVGVKQTRGEPFCGAPGRERIWSPLACRRRLPCRKVATLSLELAFLSWLNRNQVQPAQRTCKGVRRSKGDGGALLALFMKRRIELGAFSRRGLSICSAEIFTADMNFKCLSRSIHSRRENPAVEG